MFARFFYSKTSPCPKSVTLVRMQKTLSPWLFSRKIKDKQSSIIKQVETQKQGEFPPSFKIK